MSQLQRNVLAKQFPEFCKQWAISFDINPLGIKSGLKRVENNNLEFVGFLNYFIRLLRFLYDFYDF